MHQIWSPLWSFNAWCLKDAQLTPSFLAELQSPVPQSTAGWPHGHYIAENNPKHWLKLRNKKRLHLSEARIWETIFPLKVQNTIICISLCSSLKRWPFRSSSIRKKETLIKRKGKQRHLRKGECFLPHVTVRFLRVPHSEGQNAKLRDRITEKHRHTEDHAQWVWLT